MAIKICYPTIGQKIDLLERLKDKCKEQDKQILSDIIANDLYWQLDCAEEFRQNKLMALFGRVAL